jgi:hypothetical protein
MTEETAYRKAEVFRLGRKIAYGGPLFVCGDEGEDGELGEVEGVVSRCGFLDAEGLRCLVVFAFEVLGDD